MNAPHGLKDETPKRTSWQSFNAAHDGITDGALFGKAHDHGWLEDGQATDVSQLLRKPSPERAERQPVPPRKPLPNMSAAEVWARCEVATGQHSYIAKKQGSPEGMRVVPAGDELTIAGQRIAVRRCARVRRLHLLHRRDRRRRPEPRRRDGRTDSFAKPRSLVRACVGPEDRDPVESLRCQGSADRCDRGR